MPPFSSIELDAATKSKRMIRWYEAGKIAHEQWSRIMSESVTQIISGFKKSEYEAHLSETDDNVGMCSTQNCVCESLR